MSWLNPDCLLTLCTACGSYEVPLDQAPTGRRVVGDEEFATGYGCANCA